MQKNEDKHILLNMFVLFYSLLLNAEDLLMLKIQKFEYVEWTKIPDKTDNNNPFENLKRDYDNL